MKRLIFVLAAGLLASSLGANPIGVGVILIPVNPGVIRGANGSQWVTTLWARNPTASDARIETGGDLSTWPVIAAHSTTLLPPPYPTPHPGFFLNTRSNNGFFNPPDVWLELRTVDSAALSHNAGTTVPLPTLNDFRSGTIVFPNVPANGHSRIKLRIYATSDSNAAVRIIDGDQVVQSNAASVSGAGGSLYPAYAEIDIPSATPTEALRVEIDATEPTWAFISVTDDVTNEFTIVAPHLPAIVVLSNA